MFKGILQKYSVRVWHEFILLITNCVKIIMNPVSTKVWGISWPAKQLSTSQAGLHPFELLSKKKKKEEKERKKKEFHCPETKSLSILQESGNIISHLGLLTAWIVYCLVLKNNKTLTRLRLSAVFLRIRIFCDKMMCHLLSGSWCFKGITLLQNVWNLSLNDTVLYPKQIWLLKKK